MVTISCGAKLHAFSLAEQLAYHSMLDGFYTTYASQKNTIMQRFVRRKDKENIEIGKIHTKQLLAIPVKFWQAKVHIWNNLFDKWVAKRIKESKSKIFIGWSGMSLQSIRVAKAAGMITIVERGSSHIQFQNRILTQEYGRYGIDFYTHPDVINTELKEYEEADYISVPSLFVKRTFLEKGIRESKIFLNPYGANTDFTDSRIQQEEKPGKLFKILYLGALSVRKGLPYLFEALNSINIPLDLYEVTFIGKIDREFNSYCKSYRKDNWNFLGHIDHNDLPEYIRSADVGVIPSIEDGFGLVIPQIMACRVPVITTTNAGGSDLIRDGENGFVVPIRDSRLIAQRIELLYDNPQKLEIMKMQAMETVLKGYTWADYGDRYCAFLKKLVG
jgi:glycosyltransferase involved in cell wall biosynthesis